MAGMSSRVIGLTTARHGSLWIIAHLLSTRALYQLFSKDEMIVSR
jgi:hypothetical protein